MKLDERTLGFLKIFTIKEAESSFAYTVTTEGRTPF
jgi:hypothetical protein